MPHKWPERAAAETRPAAKIEHGTEMEILAARPASLAYRVEQESRPLLESSRVSVSSNRFAY